MRAKKWLLGLLMLILPIAARGQGVRYDNNLLGQLGVPLAGVNVAVCSGASIPNSYPCNTLASIYTNETLTTGATNPFTTSATGAYGFWANPGHYIVQLYGVGLSSIEFDVFLPCDPSFSYTGGCGSSPAISDVQLPDLIWNCASPPNTQTLNGQNICNMPLSGTLAQGTYALEQASTVFRGPLIPPGALAATAQTGLCTFLATDGVGSCTLTLSSPSPVGAVAYVTVCSNSQSGCTNGGPAISDPAGDTFTEIGSTFVWRAALTSATPTITCAQQTGGGLQSGEGVCIAVLVLNDGGVDASAYWAVTGGQFTSVETSKGSVTTTTANDLLLTFGAQGSDWPCIATSTVLVPSLGLLSGGQIYNDHVTGIANGMYLGAFASGAAITGAYGSSLIDSGLVGAAGCGTGSAGANGNISAIAIKGASTTPPAGIPFFGKITQSDLGSASNGYGLVEINGSALPPRPILNFLGTLTGVDNTSNNSTDVTPNTGPKISLGHLGVASCVTGTSAYSSCTSVITISPTQADTSYMPVCMGTSPTGIAATVQSASATSTTTITVTVRNGDASGAVASSFGDIWCAALHP